MVGAVGVESRSGAMQTKGRDEPGDRTLVGWGKKAHMRVWWKESGWCNSHCDETDQNMTMASDSELHGAATIIEHDEHWKRGKKAPGSRGKG